MRCAGQEPNRRRRRKIDCRSREKKQKLEKPVFGEMSFYILLLLNLCYFVSAVVSILYLFYLPLTFFRLFRLVFF